MSTLYENIIALCNDKGISGGKMCADVGLSRGFMTDLKKGRKQNASSETIKKIAEYFGVPSDYLISGKKENAPSENEALSKFDGLTKENQEVVMKMIEALLKSQSPD